MFCVTSIHGINMSWIELKLCVLYVLYVICGLCKLSGKLKNGKDTDYRDQCLISWFYNPEIRLIHIRYLRKEV